MTVKISKMVEIFERDFIVRWILTGGKNGVSSKGKNQNGGM